jgi:hypothetical protein
MRAHVLVAFTADLQSEPSISPFTQKGGVVAMQTTNAPRAAKAR